MTEPSAKDYPEDYKERPCAVKAIETYGEEPNDD